MGSDSSEEDEDVVKRRERRLERERVAKELVEEWHGDGETAVAERTRGAVRGDQWARAVEDALVPTPGGSEEDDVECDCERQGGGEGENVEVQGE